MYLLKFFIRSIPWQIALVISLFWMKSLLIIFMDNFSFSWGTFFPTLLNTFLLFVAFAVMTTILKAGLIDPFIKLKKENFLAKYHFPPKLYLMLETRFSQLEKNEIEEIVSLLRDYFGFLLNREEKTQTTLPSFSVGFAYKCFMELEEHELFGDKLFGEEIPTLPFSLKNHKRELTPLAIEHQDPSTIELWCYLSLQEGIDPYFPDRLPNLFQIDERLKIPSGFSYIFDEYQLISAIPLDYAPSPLALKKEALETIKTRPSLLRVAKKIQYLLGEYAYCKEYERKEIEALFAVIDKNEPLSRAVYGKYGNSDLKISALNSAKVEENSGGCSSGASL